MSSRLDLTRDQIQSIVGDDFEAIRAFEDLFYEATVSTPIALKKSYIGEEVVGGTPGSVLFVDSVGNLGQDPLVFSWDDSNNYLGVGTSSPSARLEVFAAGGILMRLAQDAADYVDFNVGGSGDLDISPTGQFTTINSWLNVDAITDTGFVEFDNAYVGTPQEARLQWNSTDGTLDLGMPGGNVVLQIGQETLIKATNNTGLTISNGEVVHKSGASGGDIRIGIPSASSQSDSLETIAIATEDIASLDSGYCTAFGFVRDFDTSSFVAGDTLYLDTVAGGLVNAPPSKPNRTVRVGFVTESDATNGIVFANINPIPFITELSDVVVTGVSDGDIIYYDSGTQTYINGGLSSIPSTGFTQGSVIFQGATSLAEDNTNLFWDDSNDRLGIGTAVPIAKLDVAGSKSEKITEVDAATYTIAITDRIIAVDYTGTGAVTLTLPAASTAWNSTDSTGIQFMIKDTGANASTNNITINRAGADTIIDSATGQTSTIIGGDGEAIWIGIKDSTTWMVY